MKVKWFCPFCNRRGTVDYEHWYSITRVCRDIRDDHGKYSRFCDGDIRVGEKQVPISKLEAVKRRQVK